MYDKATGYQRLVNAAYEACANGGEDNLINSITHLRMSGNVSGANAMADGLRVWQDEQIPATHDEIVARNRRLMWGENDEAMTAENLSQFNNR